MTSEQRLNLLCDRLRDKLKLFGVRTKMSLEFADANPHTGDPLPSIATFYFEVDDPDRPGHTFHYSHSLGKTSIQANARDDRYWGYLENWLPTHVLNEFCKAYPTIRDKK